MPMPEAVTMPSLTIMSSIISKESLATDTHRHGLGLSMSKFDKKQIC